MFALIAEAYDVLSDEARRARYDETGLSEKRFGGYPSVRLMRRSKVAEKKEWKTVRVKLWEKVNG